MIGAWIVQEPKGTAIARDFRLAVLTYYSAITFMFVFRDDKNPVHIELLRLTSPIPRWPSSPLMAPVRPDSYFDTFVPRPPHTSSVYLEELV